MLKQTITYTDFDDNPCQETLYFNLTKTELLDNIELKTRFAGIKESLEGDKRELTESETREVLDLVKTLMRLSYGERSADGKRFKKGDDLWQEFSETAAYDAFLFSLFENPEKAVAFITGIFPKELAEEARKSIDASMQEKSDSDSPVEKTPQPSENTLAPVDIRDLPREELVRMMMEKSQGFELK